MNEEMIKNTEPVVDSTVDSTTEPDNSVYIKALQEVHSTHVPLVKYQKLEKENIMLVDALKNGGQLTTVSPEETKPSAKEIALEMSKMKNGKFDAKFMEKALEFRERVLEETGEDCFVSMGHRINPTQESYMKAQHEAEVYREALEYASGDNEVFINELQRRMIESPFANINNKIKNRR